MVNNCVYRLKRKQLFQQLISSRRVEIIDIFLFRCQYGLFVYTIIGLRSSALGLKTNAELANLSIHKNQWAM